MCNSAIRSTPVLGGGLGGRAGAGASVGELTADGSAEGMTTLGGGGGVGSGV